MAICEFPMKLLTPEFDSFTPITLYGERYFGDLKMFSVDFAFNILNVHHTSTSGLLDRLS